MAHVHFVMEVDGEEDEFVNDEAEWEGEDEAEDETAEDLLNRLFDTFSDDEKVLEILDLLDEVLNEDDE